MNRPFITVLFVLLIVVALGFYRGWFTLSRRSPDAESNQVNINLTVDPDKVKADAETVKGKTLELTGRAKDKSHKLHDPATDSK